MAATITQVRLPAEAALVRRIAGVFDRWMTCIEGIGRHRMAAVGAVFAFSLAFRAAAGLVLPHPVPGVDDEFSNLLAGDTFASGRLANPQHPMWPFFESLHVIVHPAYASKYPPAQGMFLALGQKLFGDPAVGVFLSVALFAAAVCWALQACVSPGWALLGGFFTALTFGPGHYWMESYWGGAVAALGAALAIGAFRRMTTLRAPRYTWVFELGTLLLVNSRPFEGGVLAVCLGVLALIHPDRRRFIGRLLASATIIAAAMGYYNWRLTGSAVTMPYALYQAQYGPAPTLWALPARLAKTYGYPDLERVFRHFLGEWELIRAWSFPKRLEMLVMRLVLVLSLGVSPVAFVGLLFAPLVRRSAAVKTLAIAAAVSTAAVLLDVSLFLHYAAPLIAVLIIFSFIVLCRLSRFGGKDPFAARAITTVLILVMFAWPAARAAMALTGTNVTLYRPESRMARVAIAQMVAREPGRHVIFVRYGANRDFEWVYNGANIDAARIIWAHDLGEERDRALMNYYAGRRFWLLVVDTPRVSLSPYSRM